MVLKSNVFFVLKKRVWGGGVERDNDGNRCVFFYGKVGKMDLHLYSHL